MYGTGDYYRWLVNKCGKYFNEKTYLNLLNLLWNAEFYPMVQMDQNRIGDAKKLRHDFLYYENFNETDAEIWIDLNIPFECSVLELILIMSDKCAFLIGTSTDDDSEVGRVWFWRMIANLGLLPYDDAHWSSRSVNEIIRIFLNRKYSSNGEGGLFPVIGSDRDERKIDLMYQMYKYLLTYYDDEIQ